MKKIKGGYWLLRFVLGVMLVMIIGVTYGCKKREQEQSDYQIYYMDKEKASLLMSGYNTDTSDVRKLAEELLVQMKKAPDNMDMQKVMPENVKIQSIDMENYVLHIDYNAEYASMKKKEEYLCRAATVLTLTQIENINFVVISIDGQGLTDSQGNPVGALRAADFVDNSGATINSYKSVKYVLYFANEDGTKLVDKTYDGITSNNTSMEKYVVEQLIKGPSDFSVNRTLSSHVKLLSISTVDGVCYVNFDEAFLNESEEVSSEVAIYSVVNSLCDLGYINKVQISVNGDVELHYHENIPLNQPFMRNLDLLEKKN